MSMQTRLLALALLALAAACGPAPDDRAGAVPSPTVSADPAALVGFWQVEDDGKPAGVLRVGAQLTLFLDCGALDAEWKASHDGGFVAGSSSGDDTCYRGSASQLPAWVHAAQGFRVSGADRSLVDGHGAVLVTLSPSDPPRIRSNRSAEVYGARPTVAEAARSLVPEPAPLPDGLTAATHDSLTGVRWQGSRNPKAYLRFSPDGSYDGSDGCNGEGGRYALGADGEILAVSGGSTLIGCQNDNVGSQLFEAARAAVDGDQLVLLDAAAKEIVRLART